MLKRRFFKYFAITPELKVFCVLIFAISIGASTYVPIISRYVETFTPNPIAIGLLATLAWTVYMLLAEPAGYLCDKLGSKRMVLIGGLLAGFGALLIFSINNIFVYIIACFLWGSGDALFWSATKMLTVELSSKTNRTFSFGMYDSSWGFGWAFGPLIGGAAAYIWGLSVPFLFFGIIVLATLPFFIKYVPETKCTNTKIYTAVKELLFDGKAAKDGIAFLRVSSSKVRFALSIKFALYATFALVEVFLPLLRDNFNNLEIGIVFFVWAAVCALTEIFAGALGDKYGRRTFIAFGFIGAGISLALIAVSSSFVPVLCFTVMLALTTAFIEPLVDAFFYDSIKKSVRGLASGLSISAAGLGYVIAPIVGGILAYFGGYIMPLYLASGILIFSSIASVIFMYSK